MPERSSAPSLFPAVDVTPVPPSHTHHTTERVDYELIKLFRDLVTAQDRQNELLEELVSQMSAAQRQRNQELQQWKNANPDLSSKCRQAAEVLSQVQTSFLQTVAEDTISNADVLLDGEFMLSEFVDRFGPRMAHLNGILQVLAQLGTPTGDAR